MFQPSQQLGGEGGEVNVLSLSRGFPDPRGGLSMAGGEPALVEATRSIKVSERRVADWAAAQ